MGVRTTHAWRLGGFNPACHSGWLLYDNTKGLSIGGVCFFAIALQEHWNRLIARVFSNGADASPQHKQTNKQTTMSFSLYEMFVCLLILWIGVAPTT